MYIQEYAGKNLWVAVVEQALYDFQKAKGAKKEAIRREIHDPWFAQVCSNANMDHGCVLAVLDRKQVLIPAAKAISAETRHKWKSKNNQALYHRRHKAKKMKEHRSKAE